MADRGAATEQLTVSALVCTRNRGEAVVRTARSILRPDSICRELIVVDQSEDDSTREALAPLMEDLRLRYIRSDSVGKGRALNEGLAEATGEIVAITDDDCEVDERWPRFHVEVLAGNPQVGVTFGNVMAAEHDASLGFVPAYVSRRDRLCRNIWQKLPARGIGANMAVRRRLALELGGFDPLLGPGGRFHACVDGDMAVRCLLSGHHVFEIKRSRVLHSGFRGWEEGRTLTRNAWFGIAAAYVKPLKCGRWQVLPLFLYEFVWGALLPFLRALLTFRRPLGWLRIVSFLRGAYHGWRTPVDCRKVLYRSDGAPAPRDRR